MASFTATARFCSGPEIPLRGLERRMAEQELYLLEIPAGLAAELRAGAPEVVRGKLPQ
jgi:hypothetical protein